MARYSLFISISAASTATPPSFNKSSMSCGRDTTRNPSFFIKKLNWTIQSAKKKYKDEWVVAEILKEDECGKPLEVWELNLKQSTGEDRKNFIKADDKNQ